MTIVVHDSNPPGLVPATKIADTTEQAPPLADPRFVDFIVGWMRRHAVNVYFPILDDEIALIAQMSEDGRLPDDLVACVPSAEVSRLCYDKLEFAEWLERRGIASPRTVLATEAKWDGLPRFAKERRGYGSKRTYVVDTEEQLRSLPEPSGLVIQDRCGGPEVTVDGFRSADGQILAGLCRERLEVKAGVCTKARVYEDAGLAQVALEIAKGLPLIGGFCVQMMTSATNGQWTVTDVNPRVGGGTPMSVALGFDPGAATLAHALGCELDPFLRMPTGEHLVVRTYQEWVM
jgi:carbamoylphosphate synthase large subunit